LRFSTVDDRATALSPGEWAVLGLIAEQARHGFALRKALQAKGLAAVVGAERRFMLKLALLHRAGEAPQRLLDAQRERLGPIVAALEERARTDAGFDRALATWRMESARAAVRFLDGLSNGASR